jgi:hypothetical protein
MVKTAFISEYKTEICMTREFFGETIHDDTNPYVAEYHIIDNNKKKGKCIMMNYRSNQYNPGKYSVMEYIQGIMVVKKEKVNYFAFYFGGYDKTNLINVGEVQEETDTSKYTWCVQHKIGNTNNTVEELAEIAKKIKAKYIKRNS